MYFRSLRKTAQDVSLSDCIETGGDGGALSLMDVVGQESDMSEVLAGQETLTQLRRAVQNCLTEQERQVVELRYGLTGMPPKRQREVAQLTGISRSYVSCRHYCKRCLERMEVPRASLLHMWPLVKGRGIFPKTVSVRNKGK